MIYSWKHLFVSFEHKEALGDDTWPRHMIQLNWIVSFISPWVLSWICTAKAKDVQLLWPYASKLENKIILLNQENLLRILT